MIKRTTLAAQRIFASPMNTKIAEFLALAILGTIVLTVFTKFAGR